MVLDSLVDEGCIDLLVGSVPGGLKEGGESEAGFGGFKGEREESCSSEGCYRGKGGPPREAGGGMKVVDEGGDVL